jgi:nucleotide-binding universal stress UspA family protein
VIRGKSPHVPPPRGVPVDVGVDGSPAGRAALDVAAGMAQVLGARLVGTRAWSDVVAGSGGSAHRRPEEWPALAAEAEDLLSAELGRVSAGHPQLAIEHDVDEDTPLRALLDRAGSARMLVGRHRGSGPQTSGPQTSGSPSGMLLGSTSRGLVEFAECPVVVVGPAMVAAQPVAADRMSGS